ncbi:MAG: indolepyruvate oxidoreductase subunit beta [Anaerolineae bacterium]|nr:MAG: indolepyruvate oxidoreductase subunit beta [Anaerolineae bacterium]
MHRRLLQGLHPSEGARVSASDLGELRVVIAGIGGQGVIFATRLLTYAAIRLGLQAIAAESHGMSQRGGSVVSHLKVGGIQSPLIRRGTADVVLGLDRNEALRSLVYLKAGGAAFINSDDGLSSEVERQLKRRGTHAHWLPASQTAIDLGSVTVANVVLIGFASAHPSFPFPQESLQETLRVDTPRGQDLNLQALDRGREIALGELARASGG